MHLLKDEREAPFSHAMYGEERENMSQMKAKPKAAACQAHIMYKLTVLEGIYIKNESSFALFLFCVVRSSPNPASSSSAYRAALSESHQDNYSRTGIRSTSICLSFC